MSPTAAGTPWLGMLVFSGSSPPSRPARVRHASRHFRARYGAYQSGEISFAEFDASVRGWIAHTAHADSWGLRRHVLAPFVLRPGDTPVRRWRRTK